MPQANQGAQVKKTVSDGKGNIIDVCSYSFTDSDGHVETCRAHAKCPICGQCSRIVDNKENGHCTGHLGLNEHILASVPNRGTV